MSEFLKTISDLQTPFNMVAIICLIFAVAGVIGTIAKQIRKYVCHRQEMEFKRELLDRGMGGDEIEQVVRAHGEQASDA